MPTVRRLATDELTNHQVMELRELFRAAYDDPSEEFTDEDWNHAVGGAHFIIEADGAIVAHASVGERELHAGDHRLATGYVEAVATSPLHQRRGLGSALMDEVNAHIDRTFQLGALGTGVFAFYESLGWVRWQGPTFVRSASGLVRTPQEDGYVLVRFTPTTPDVDVSGPISCNWRSGDPW